MKASKHEDALGLIRHFEEYAQAVLGAYAKELIPIKTELDEYLKELQDCAERFRDYILPHKLVTEDDIEYLIKNPGFTPCWAPSGYWEETFLDCWNRLASKGHLPPTADVSHAFDWVFRWAFRRSQDAWAFRKRLKAHLEIGIADCRAEWLETRAKQGAENTLQPHEANPKSAPQSDSQRPLQLELMGKTMGVASNEVSANGAIIRIGDVPFLLLARLVADRFKSNDGWIHKVELVRERIISEKHQNQSVARLRRHFRKIPDLKDPQKLIISSRDGRLKLGVGPGNIRFDKKALLSHPDQRIKQVAKLLPDAQKV